VDSPYFHIDLAVGARAVECLLGGPGYLVPLMGNFITQAGLLDVGMAAYGDAAGIEARSEESTLLVARAN